MSRAIITESKLTAIADAIRAKTGGSAEMTVDEMASAIAAMPTGGASDVLIPATLPFPSVTETIT